MDRRVGIIFWGLAAFAMLFWASLSIIKGGLLDLATAVVLISPFLLIIFIRYRKYWHMLIPVFIVAMQVKIPIYGLKQLTLSFVLLSVAMVVLILDRSMHFLEKKRDGGWVDKLVLVIALILTTRLIHDRPGFIALGAGEGDFISSFTFVMASWFYFTAQRIASMGKFTRKQLQVASFAVLLVGVHDMVKGDRTNFLFRPLGSSSFWMLCAMVLALLATSTVQQRRTLFFYITSLAFMAGGIISGYRSRFFFFFTEIMAVSYFTRRVRKNLLVIGISGVAGIFLLISVSGETPALMRRFASLFTTVEMSEAYVGGAVGRTDDFRSELSRLAWVEIKKHPFIGKGFGLNVSDAIGVLMGDNATFSFLAMSGAYHNSVLVLAVKAGMPVALLFCIISIAIPVRFARKVMALKGTDFRVWGIAIFSYWCANTWMLLINGGPTEYFVCMVLNGYMMGMLRNPAAREVQGEVACRVVA